MCQLCNHSHNHSHASHAQAAQVNFEFTDSVSTQSGSTPDADFINTLVSGFQWSTRDITYSFDSINGNYGDQGLTNYQLFNDAQQDATRAAFDEFEKVANINFTETNSTSPAKADIVLRAADFNSNTAGWAFFPTSRGSDITIDNIYNGQERGRLDAYYGLDKGEFGFHLLLHEIAHAVGLDHPHASGLVSAADDTQNASVLSYNDSNASSTGGLAATRVGPTGAQTLMIYDIAALQLIYGANYDYNAGDDIYELTGDVYIGTRWDGNGIDTLSSESYRGNATLDLREGLDYVTTVGSSSTWNAFGANIENASGGNGNDTIYGNDLNNVVLGRSGNDIIQTGAGDDFVNGNRNNDTIEGGEGDDTLYGGKDNDSIHGGDDNDFINGNNANDIVHGDAGDDVIRGGKNDDTLYGGLGDDSLYGDRGDDILLGGEGDDSFIFSTTTGDDIIQDFSLTDDIILLIDTDFLDISSLLSTGIQNGDDAILHTSSNSQITLQNINILTLGDSNFELI